MKRLFILLFGLVVLTQTALAQTVEEQYVRVYNLIQQADALRQSGDVQSALPKYLEAQTSLNQIHRQNPTWQPKVVNFRLNYVANKIAEIPGAAPVTTPAAPTTGTPEKKTPPAAVNNTPAANAAANAESAQQLAELQNAMKQLQAEKMVLEAKLKEALATQPATVDPRELAKAQEQVQSLLKENELLKAGLEQDKNRPAVPVINPKELEDAKRLLAETNAKLVEQQSLNEKLTAEKTSLAGQLGKAAAGVEVAAALRAENELLKKQLGEAKAAVAAVPVVDEKSTETSRKLAEAEAQLAALTSSTEMLRLEKAALETRLKQAPVAIVPTVAAPAPAKAAPVARSSDDVRIKELERQRDSLFKLLAKRGNEAQDAYSRELQTKVEQLNGEVESLKSRLAVFEAKATPYSAEELALFRQPQPKPVLAPVKAVVAPEGKPTQAAKPAKELPAGTVALVAQAEKYFANKQYDKAEENYLTILRQDENNAYTLANLGAIQMEQGRLAEAETNILRALAVAPDDAHANSLLGYLKFRQEKYDDAVGALNRAAQLNPQNADIQNYLGVTLSQKGLRGPAEQAFRKAIVLDPNHGGAQNNLAVFYASENPPNVPLARFHYQKALAAGHPHNPELEQMLDKKEAAAKP